MTDNHGERIARLETRAETMERVLVEINDSLKRLTDNVVRMEGIQQTLSRHERAMNTLDEEISQWDEKVERKVGDLKNRIEEVAKKADETDHFVRSRWWAIASIVSGTIILVELFLSFVNL